MHAGFYVSKVGVEGLIVCLDSDVINRGRRLDPVVLVFHFVSQHCSRTTCRPYPMSSLGMDVSSEKLIAELREIAAVRDPNRRWLLTPYRSAI